MQYEEAIGKHFKPSDFIKSRQTDRHTDLKNQSEFKTKDRILMKTEISKQTISIAKKDMVVTNIWILESPLALQIIGEGCVPT